MNASMAQMEPSRAPSREEILVQLEGIAKSGVFHAKPDEDTQQLKILRHVIAERLAGRTPTQRTILEWLGLDAPVIDKDESTVRVQMRIIRRKLSRYYRQVAPGCVTVVIDIPIGQYAPTFAYPAMAGSWTAADTADLGAAQAACDRQTISSCAEALTYVHKVLTRHKDYPPALALKADIHVIRAIQGMPPRPELDEALAAARRALAIAPDLWQAHNAYGRVQSSLRNWREAHKAFARARMYTPPDVPVHFSYIAYLVSRGRLEDAIRLMERDATMAKGYYGHPTLANPVIRADLGFLQLLADDLEAARATLESTIRDAPSGFFAPYLYQALVHEAAGDPEAALVVLARCAPVPPGVGFGVAGMLHGLADHRAKACSALEALLAASAAGRYVPAFQLAHVHLGLRDHDTALSLFRQAAEARDPLFHWVPYLPHLRHLAHLPEFHAFLGELGLAWHWRRAARNAPRTETSAAPSSRIRRHGH